jgi:hypothetical protein
MGMLFSNTYDYGYIREQVDHSSILALIWGRLSSLPHRY